MRQGQTRPNRTRTGARHLSADTFLRIPIQTESIELGALLKWAGIAPTGGEAKRLIQQGRVRVNGQTERRRGRRILPGDRVDVGEQAVLIERHTPQ